MSMGDKTPQGGAAGDVVFCLFGRRNGSLFSVMPCAVSFDVVLQKIKKPVVKVGICASEI